MAAKEQALAKLESLQTPEPKRRRTAHEQAIGLLATKRDKLWTAHLAYYEREQAKFRERTEASAAKAKAEMARIDASIKALRDSEQAPESE